MNEIKPVYPQTNDTLNVSGKAKTETKEEEIEVFNPERIAKRAEVKETPDWSQFYEKLEEAYENKPNKELLQELTQLMAEALLEPLKEMKVNNTQKSYYETYSENNQMIQFNLLDALPWAKAKQ